MYGKLWNVTLSLNMLNQPEWSQKAEVILKDFQMAVFRSVKEDGWDGREESDEEMMWSFAGSLLYSVTIITTIGQFSKCHYKF